MNVETKNFKQKIKKSGGRELSELMDNIGKFEHQREFKIVEEKSRKLRNITIGTLMRSNDDIKMASKVVTVREWKRELNVNKNNRLVGFTPFHIGSRPSKRINENQVIADTLIKNSELIKKSGKLMSESWGKSILNPRVVYSGGTDTNIGHLNNFIKHKDDVLSVEEIIEIASKSNWFDTINIDFDDPTEMYDHVNINPKSSPGLMFSRIFKTQMKGVTMESALVGAYELYDQIRNKPMRNWSLWEILSREKDNKISDTKDFYSTRCVMNPEHHVTLILSWVMQKFQKGLERFSDKPHYLLDDEYNGKKATKILKRLMSGSYDYLIDLDWSLFDSTQTKNWLLAACSIIFSKSIKNDEDMRFFYFITSSLITKYIAVPPGLVIELNKGLPSGHPGVTLINCIVNLLRLSVMGYLIYGDEYGDKMDPFVYGDDTLCAFKYNENLFKIEYYRQALEFEGDVLTGRLYPIFMYFSADENKPDYLKRVCESWGVRWTYEKVFNKLLYQSKQRSIVEQCDVLYNYVLGAPNDIRFNTILLKVLSDIIKEYRVENNDKYILDPLFHDKNNNFVPYIDNELYNNMKWSLSHESGVDEIYLPNIMWTEAWNNFDLRVLKKIIYFSNDIYYLNKIKEDEGYIPFKGKSKWFNVVNNEEVEFFTGDRFVNPEVVRC